MLRKDDLKTGQFVTIHHGHNPTCPCGCGAKQGEMYGELKGVPLAVKAINLPYIVAYIVPGGQPAVLDARLCELCEVSTDYVNALCVSAKKPAQSPPPTGCAH